jgi:hypothetical protein
MNGYNKLLFTAKSLSTHWPTCSRHVHKLCPLISEGYQWEAASSSHVHLAPLGADPLQLSLQLALLPATTASPPSASHLYTCGSPGISLAQGTCSSNSDAVSEGISSLSRLSTVAVWSMIRISRRASGMRTVAAT